MVAFNYAPASSGAVRERQVGTEREIKAETKASWEAEGHAYALQKNYIEKPRRVVPDLSSIGLGSLALSSHCSPALYYLPYPRLSSEYDYPSPYMSFFSP